MSLKIDLTGRRFGRLVVLREAEQRSKSGEVMWVCRCDCGNICEKVGLYLRCGDTKSCGCICKNGDQRRTHGDAGHSNTARLYRTWQNMKSRCNNPSNPGYKNYGGRGIQVCDEWVNSYAKFKEWAMSNGYADNLTIERIDVDGGYYPDNCTWIPRSEQSKNVRSRTHVYVQLEGKRVNTTALAKRYGIPVDRLWSRLRNGWDLDRALTQPKTYGELTRLARDHGKSLHLVADRLKRGWSLDRALNTPVDNRFRNKKAQGGDNE